MTHDADIERIVESVGYLHPSQRTLIRDALDENHDGVISLAERITASELDSPVGALINSIKRGQHKRKAKREAKRTTPRDAFRRLHAAKLRYLEEIGWGADDEERQREAIDYAVSYISACRISAYPAGETPLTLEAELYTERAILDVTPSPQH